MTLDRVAPATTVSAGGRTRVPSSRKKRVLFWLPLLGGTWLTVELISLSAIYFSFGGWSEVQRIARHDADPDVLTTSFDDPDEIVHPYLGWVRSPRPNAGEAAQDTVVNDYGFPGGASPLQTRSQDRIIIGILGGSLAEQFSSNALEVLAADLKKCPYFEGKELVFARLALSGYKQPQQLMTVSYLLALGGQFDILINIDGYNEIVLPVVENLPNHVFTGFPRSWHLRVTDAGDLSVMRTIGRVANLKDRAAYWSRVVQARPWCYSPVVNLAWRLHRASLKADLLGEYSKLYALKYGDWNYAAYGPVQQFAGTADRYEHCAAIWMRSSLELHQLSVANGIRYYHFLQPNQYVSGSKSMTEQERLATMMVGHPGRVPVEEGYPILVREGRRLTSQGVSFTDLTMLFADHPEQTYNDVCCHLNGRGNELLAHKIAEVIRDTIHSD
jgi:hypothetical protein